MTDMLPCPFCGETKRLVVYTQEYNGYYHSAQVDCENDDCLASGPTILAPSKTQHDGFLKQQATEAWNRRAAISAMIGNTLYTVTVQQETPAPDMHSYSEDEEA